MENLETKEDQKSKYRAEENKLNLFNSMPESSRVVDDCDDAKNGDAKPDIKLTNEDYIAISVGAIVIFIIVVIILCIGLSSNGELSEKQKLAMLKVQDDTYVLFEDNVYKKVDGNDY